MIVHVFNSSLISGPETLVLPALSSLHKTKQEVKIIWLKESRIAENKQQHVADYFQKLRLPYVTVPIKKRFDKSAIQNLSQTLLSLSQQNQLQVAHAHDVKASMYLLKASQLLKTRTFNLVSTHHGVHARSGIKNYLYARYYENFILPYYDQTLVVCSSDKQLLINRGLKENQVTIHLNGVTRPKISLYERSHVQNEIRKKWQLDQFIKTDLSDKPLIIGVAARIEVEKQHSLILEVFRQLKINSPELKWHLLCFGRGQLEYLMKEKTQQLGLNDVVTWMGYRAGLSEEFAGFDVLLSLSKAEGLPINLIEAGWAGTPVFATAVDGVTDLISNSSLGELVPLNTAVNLLAEKLNKFMMNPAHLREIGKNFQNHVEINFSQDHWLRELLKIYEILRRQTKKNSL